MPIAVGERKLLRLDHEMQRVGALCSHRLQIEAFHDLQHLKRDEAMSGGRQLVNIVAPVVRCNRLDPIRAMIGKVFEREQPPFFSEQRTIFSAISPL